MTAAEWEILVTRKSITYDIWHHITSISTFLGEWGHRVPNSRQLLFVDNVAEAEEALHLITPDICHTNRLSSQVQWCGLSS